MAEIEVHKKSGFATFMGKLNNPTVLFVIVAFISTISIALFNIDNNTKDIESNKDEILAAVEILDQRLDKKIVIINENRENYLMLQIALKDEEIEHLEEVSKMKLKQQKEHFELKIEIEKLKVEQEYTKYIVDKLIDRK